MLRVKLEKELPEYRLAIEFEVDGQVLVLFGPSGCGKTTTLRCIAGLVRPGAGKISLGPTILYDGSAQVWVVPARRGVGYVFQDYALFPHMTVAKNVMYGVKTRGEGASERSVQLMKRLKIGSLANRFPGELSGGERQRVALARALMAEPQVLLLDEPLTALDGATRSELQDELLRLHSEWQIPFVLVTHDLEEAHKLGDRILYLERGRVCG
ncbi:MAG: ATP-binding cassette domain-containing protein [Bacillota bacterium]|jgi:molybdate transport system ATP-binding protein